MSDRSQLLVYLVAAGLCIAGLLAWLRPDLSRIEWPRPRPLTDWKRWFGIGLLRARALPSVWWVLAITVAIQTVAQTVQIERWMISQGMEASQFSGYSHLASWGQEIRHLGSRALWGGAKLIPFPQTAILALLPLLQITRRRGTFPGKSGLGIRTFWVVVGRIGWLLFLASWLITPFPSIAEGVSNRLATLSGFGLVLGFVAMALFGFGVFLPPFFASLDERIDARLSKEDRFAISASVQLVGLHILMLVASGPTALILQFSGGARLPLPWLLRFLDALDPLLRVSVVPFLITATLPACLFLSVRETMAKNWQWWKRDVLFFLPLLLLAGLLDGVISLMLRGLLGGLPQGLVTSAVRSVLHEEAGLAISALAFCILLGNWLEREPAQEAPSKTTTLPGPAG